jgi:KipI family sensor histidine kinase inhibitor
VSTPADPGAAPARPAGSGGYPVVRTCGDGAVLVELGAEIGLEVNRRVRQLAAAIEAMTDGRAGWGVPVPGACSVLVPVDPLEPGAAAAAIRLGELVATLATAGPDLAADEAGPVLEIPTRYDGPDLEAVAEMTRLRPAAVAEAHAAPTYVTLFLGFVPGFGYLGPLPKEIMVPRRPVPRTNVPAGAVAIAGPQTAVYPIESPGGWWLIGRTNLRFWDPGREPPALLRPGRRVRFVPAKGER